MLQLHAYVQCVHSQTTLRLVARRVACKQTNPTRVRSNSMQIFLIAFWSSQPHARTIGKIVSCSGCLCGCLIGSMIWVEWSEWECMEIVAVHGAYNGLACNCGVKVEFVSGDVGLLCRMGAMVLDAKWWCKRGRERLCSWMRHKRLWWWRENLSLIHDAHLC